MLSFSTEMQDQIKEDLWDRHRDSFRRVGSRSAMSPAPGAKDDEQTATTLRHAALASGRPIEA
jgi:hypothetical protein